MCATNGCLTKFKMHNQFETYICNCIICIFGYLRKSVLEKYYYWNIQISVLIQSKFQSIFLVLKILCMYQYECENENEIFLNYANFLQKWFMKYLLCIVRSKWKILASKAYLDSLPSYPGRLSRCIKKVAKVALFSSGMQFAIIQS